MCACVCFDYVLIEHCVSCLGFIESITWFVMLPLCGHVSKGHAVLCMICNTWYVMYDMCYIICHIWYTIPYVVQHPDMTCHVMSCHVISCLTLHCLTALDRTGPHRTMCDYVMLYCLVECTLATVHYALKSCHATLRLDVLVITCVRIYIYIYIHTHIHMLYTHISYRYVHICIYTCMDGVWTTKTDSHA